MTLGVGPVGPPSTGPAHYLVRERGAWTTATIELTDDLVADCVNGDGEALGAVYAVLSPKVLGYLKAHGPKTPKD